MRMFLYLTAYKLYENTYWGEVYLTVIDKLYIAIDKVFLRYLLTCLPKIVKYRLFGTIRIQGRVRVARFEIVSRVVVKVPKKTWHIGLQGWVNAQYKLQQVCHVCYVKRNSWSQIETLYLKYLWI
jgi:hypothetical protein